MNVKLTSAQKIDILNSTDIYLIMRQVLLRENKIRRGQEHFWVVGLNNKNKILFIELIGLGAQNRVQADPPDIFRMGIYKQAVRIILVHNHPSGSLDVSEADLDFTNRMLKVGKIIQIEVIDHLIITEELYKSLADDGILDNLAASPIYEIMDREKAQMQNLKMEIEKEKAEKRKALAIAQKMKAKGFDEKVIKEVTGLKVAEIKGL